jgi:hypothetical protein
MKDTTRREPKAQWGGGRERPEDLEVVEKGYEAEAEVGEVGMEQMREGTKKWTNKKKAMENVKTGK